MVERERLRFVCLVCRLCVGCRAPGCMMCAACLPFSVSLSLFLSLSPLALLLFDSEAGLCQVHLRRGRKWPCIRPLAGSHPHVETRGGAAASRMQACDIEGSSPGAVLRIILLVLLCAGPWCVVLRGGATTQLNTAGGRAPVVLCSQACLHPTQARWACDAPGNTRDSSAGSATKLGSSALPSSSVTKWAPSWSR